MVADALVIGLANVSCPMATVTVHAAKTHLSRLIEQALRGEEVIIARGDKPVVRLVPVDAPKPRRSLARSRA